MRYKKSSSIGSIVSFYRRAGRIGVGVADSIQLVKTPQKTAHFKGKISARHNEANKSVAFMIRIWYMRLLVLCSTKLLQAAIQQKNFKKSNITQVYLIGTSRLD